MNEGGATPGNAILQVLRKARFSEASGISAKTGLSVKRVRLVLTGLVRKDLVENVPGAWPKVWS